MALTVTPGLQPPTQPGDTIIIPQAVFFFSPPRWFDGSTLTALSAFVWYTTPELLASLMDDNPDTWVEFDTVVYSSLPPMILRYDPQTVPGEATLVARHQATIIADPLGDLNLSYSVVESWVLLSDVAGDHVADWATGTATTEIVFDQEFIDAYAMQGDYDAWVAGLVDGTSTIITGFEGGTAVTPVTVRFREVYIAWRGSDVIRRYPRDDGRGMSSAPRLFPPTKANRVFGGYQ